MSDDDDAPGDVIVATMDQPNNEGAAVHTSSPVNAASGDRPGRRRPSVAESHESEPTTKKMKRGKYISRACISCQRRKIKCEGGDPCAQCKAKNRVCVSTARGQPKPDTRNQAASTADGTSTTTSTEQSKGNHELLVRVAELERRLSTMQDSARDSIAHIGLNNRRDSNSYSITRDDDASSPDSFRLHKTLETNGQSFVGELSLNPSFDGPDKSLNAYSPPDTNSIPPEFHGLDPVPPGPSRERSKRKVRGWFESLLEEHGVVADEAEWRRYMHLFFDEIHILYPILHPPTVWEIFEQLWEYSALWSMTDLAERERKRRSTALVCFCLALGRCCVSTRMTDSTGVHSSGWSLYSVGIGLMDDLSKAGSTAATSLLSLQLLLLKFLYLFRLDATQEAARLIALAISNAYIIGIHRQSTLDAMPCFRGQLFCRIWWSIFILDRRIALESGRPYLIQENISNAELPLELSDTWLSQVKDRPENTAALKNEIMAELAMGNVTTIPFLTAMVRYSRIVSKAWDLIYLDGHKASSSTSSSHMVDYADTILCNLLENLPDDLSYDPGKSTESQFGDRPRWKVKQTVLLFTCVTNLRILIRKPTTQGQISPDPHEVDQFESLTICASLAASILNAHRNLKDSSMKHCFPYCHYLISCNMVMVSLVARTPALKRKYAETILAATQSLRTYCHTIWVSGKMMRWVSRLTVLVHRLLQVEGGSPEAATKESSRLPARSGSVNGTHDVPDPLNSVDSTGHSMVPQPTPRPKVNNNNKLPPRDPTFSTPAGNNHNHSTTLDETAHHFPSLPMMGPPPATDSNGIPQLPEWAMSDFNFETVDMGGFNNQGKPDVENMPSGPEEMVQDGDFGLGPDDSMFGTLSYNFDVSMS